MWEELDPGQYNRGLYDGLASVLGGYMHGINGLAERLDVNDRAILTFENERLVRMMVMLLRSDNPHFNEARFRLGIERACYSHK